MGLEDYEFKKMLRFLSSVRGQGTELISIYIPPDYNIAELGNKLRGEYSQAENIKSKQTRKNVLGAIERILQALKQWKKPPENGLAIFCGNISNQPGVSNIKLFVVQPPKPIQVQLYRCDSSFFLEPLLEMLEPEEVYGIITIDRREATLALLKGKRVEIIKNLQSNVPGKHRAGGQCLHPETKVVLEDGSISKISEINSNRGIVSVSNSKTSVSRVKKVFRKENDEWLEIVTKYPMRKIITTGEHWFFVPGEYGFNLKQAWEIQPGDDVIMVKEIRIEGKRQKLNVKIPVKGEISEKGIKVLAKRRKTLKISQRKLAEFLGITQATVSKFELGVGKISLDKIKKMVKYLNLNWDDFKNKYIVNTQLFKFPEELNPDLARLLGYITGDGNAEPDRIRIYENELQVAKRYATLAKSLFGVNVVVRRRKTRNYYILEIYGKELIKTIKKIFPEVFTRKGVPRLIQLSDNDVIAAYISGIIDADGSVADRGISISMVDEGLVTDISLLLLRLGIVSSVREKKIRPSKIRGSMVISKVQTELLISDRDSIDKAKKVMRLLNKRKMDKLSKIRKKKTRTSQVWISGKMLIRIARDIGVNTMNFKTSSNFFRDKRYMSFEVFSKAILKPIEKRVKELERLSTRNMREFRKTLGLRMEEVARAMGVSVTPIQRLEKDNRYKNSNLERKVWKYLENERDRMLTKAKSFLKLASEAYCGDLIRAKVKSIKRIYTPTYAFDIAVPKTENFVADCFLVHNSSVRFERLIEIAAHEWFKKIGEMANQYFSGSEVKGVIIGGPGPTKNYFVNSDYLSNVIKKKIVGIVDTSYTDEFGVREVLEKSGEIMKELGVVKERKLIEEFIKRISTDGLATYGENEVRQALIEGKVDTLLVSEKLTWLRVTMKCPQCGYEEKITVKGETLPTKPCPKCNIPMQPVEEEDVVEELAKLAEAGGAKVEVISTDTPEGKQFYEGFGGIGALLRYK